MTRSARPAGLLGVTPDWDAGIGCVVGVGVKGPTGAPILKDRFFLMSPEAHSTDTSGPNKLRRDPLPAFRSWNDLSARDVRQGDPLPPTVTLRGVIAHSRLADCLRWNRAAQKAANGIKSPPSGRPWCEGNGIEALRIETANDGEERETRIPCPNEECPIAIARACKPHVELLFMLRWEGGPAWQAGFPSLLALYVSHSWHTLRNALGLFALVLGTEAVLPWEPRETWQPGLAAELGVANPSLVGFPFAMTVGEKTQPARGNQPGRRFPVVNFSAEGDLGSWLSTQIRRKQFFLAAAAGEKADPLTLPPAPPSLQDDELQPVLDLAHIEIEPSIATVELTGLKLTAPRQSAETAPKASAALPEEPPPPAMMTRSVLTRLRLEAERMGLPQTEVEEVFMALYRRATRIPLSEEHAVVTELKRRADALKAKPR